MVTIFLFPEAAELHSSRTSLFYLVFVVCDVSSTFLVVATICKHMQAFLVICPLFKQARQEIDDLKQTLAADAKAVTFYAWHCSTVFGYQVYSPN